MINFRLDRFLTLNLFKHIIKKQTSAGDKRISILMYHSISDEKDKSYPYYPINTSHTVFAEQMRFLSEYNDAVLDLDELKNCFFLVKLEVVYNSPKKPQCFFKIIARELLRIV
jgi:hypothetical protein